MGRDFSGSVERSFSCYLSLYLEATALGMVWHLVGTVGFW